MVEELYNDFKKMVHEQQHMSVREFVSTRANFRNQLLYAEDGGFLAMGETLVSLETTFKRTFHALLWTLAILLNNDFVSTRWGLATQFISLYRRVLNECRLL